MEGRALCSSQDDSHDWAFWLHLRIKAIRGGQSNFGGPAQPLGGGQRAKPPKAYF